MGKIIFLEHPIHKIGHSPGGSRKKKSDLTFHFHRLAFSRAEISGSLELEESSLTYRMN